MCLYADLHFPFKQPGDGTLTIMKSVEEEKHWSLNVLHYPSTTLTSTTVSFILLSILSSS